MVIHTKLLPADFYRLFYSGKPHCGKPVEIPNCNSAFITALQYDRNPMGQGHTVQETSTVTNSETMWDDLFYTRPLMSKYEVSGEMQEKDIVDIVPFETPQHSQTMVGKNNALENTHGQTVEGNHIKDTSSHQTPVIKFDELMATERNVSPLGTSKEQSITGVANTNLAGPSNIIMSGFTCAECGKTLSCKPCLKNHLMSHHNIRPFQCRFCLKNFVQTCTLYQHIRTRHPDEQPRRCPTLDCNKTFWLDEMYEKHVKQAHSSHDCRFCSRTYKSLVALHRHENSCYMKVQPILMPHSEYYSVTYIPAYESSGNITAEINQDTSTVTKSDVIIID